MTETLHLSVRSGFNRVGNSDAVPRQRAFTTGGALEGKYSHWDTGRLPQDWARIYRSSHDAIAYVVVSYSTPIAWYDTRGAVWIMPEVRYSPTTSNHQSAVRQALSGYTLICATKDVWPVTGMDPMETLGMVRDGDLIG